MRSIKNITLGLATVGVMSLSGCAGDYLDTIPSTSVSETTINTSLDNLYIALNGIHKRWFLRKADISVWAVNPVL